MTTRSKILYAGLLPTSDTVLYSPESGVDAYVDSITVKNKTAGSVDLTLSIEKGGGAIPSGEGDFDGHAIPTGTKAELLNISVNGRMSSSDAVRGFASSSGSLKVKVHGREVS